MHIDCKPWHGIAEKSNRNFLLPTTNQPSCTCQRGLLTACSVTQWCATHYPPHFWVRSTAPAWWNWLRSNLGWSALSIYRISEVVRCYFMIWCHTCAGPCFEKWTGEGNELQTKCCYRGVVEGTWGWARKRVTSSIYSYIRPTERAKSMKLKKMCLLASVGKMSFCKYQLSTES